MLIVILIAAIVVGAGLIYVLRHQLAATLKKPVYVLFHYYYYRDSLTTWANTHWMGVSLLKTPMDLWTYQEILYETRPDLILEMGTNKGGSALFLANLCDILGQGRIISVDILQAPEGVPQHPRIEYMIGSSTDPKLVDEIRSRMEPGERIMVILDSDHSAAHVRKELSIYSPFVTPGCYLVVEDTNVNGHPVYRSHGPGPMEALQDFLSTTNDFSSDLAREKFMITFSPRGWLKRRGNPQAGMLQTSGTVETIQKT